MSRDLVPRLTGRVPFERPFTIYLEDGDLRFEAGDRLSRQSSDEGVLVTLTVEQSRTLVQMLKSRAGTYTDAALPSLTLVIERTEIKDNEGEVVDIVE